MLNRPSSATDVVLLSDAGRPIGTASRAAVHTADTPLHLAFSSHLFDAGGRVLITRRALHKRTWPGVWTNSCCGHPEPGEDAAQAVRRRIAEELGVEVAELTLALPDFRYRAVDAGGVVENEVCPVWIGRIAAERLDPDPDEVAEHAWVEWPDFVRSVAATPQTFSPWAALQVPRLARILDERGRPLTTGVPRVPAEGETLAAVDAALAGELDAVTDAWAAWVPEVEVLPVDLPRWLAQLSARGGKRFRPRLTHWAFVGVGGNCAVGYDSMLRAAAALELLHLFALVHDDVMDESDCRRGAPSAHVQAAAWHSRAGAHGDPEVFGRNLAILLGDLAHARAARLAAGLDEPLRSAWHELGLELIAGQRADLTGAAAGRRDLVHAERIARLKSGSYSVVRPLQLGALAGGATSAQLAALADYGRHLGRAFALRDDLLGVWGDPRLTGKPVGDDLMSGKATVILALAGEALRGADADETLAALERAGVRERVEGMIADEVRAARGALVEAPLSKDGVAGLHELAGVIGWRQA